MTLFGTSAKFIDALAKSGQRPCDGHDLSTLRTVASTGSPLGAESFDFVYDAIKGDVQVIAKGAINLAVKETVNARRIEFLNATANPIDVEITGLEGRATILREVAKGLQMPVDEIVPSKEKSDLQPRTQPQQQPGQTPASPQATPTQPNGDPKGGVAGNLVQSKMSGGPR